MTEKGRSRFRVGGVNSEIRGSEIDGVSGCEST